MKTKYLAFIGAMLLANAQAATISVSTTGDGGTILANNGRAVFDQSGTALPYGGGVISVGYFSTLTSFAASDASAIAADWNQLGVSGTFGVSLGSYNLDGLFSVGPGAAIITGSTNNDFIGENIQVVIGNGSGIANSTQLLILESSTLFAADPGGDFGLDLQTGAGLTALFGSNSFDASGIAYFQDPGVNGGNPALGASNSYQLSTVIPEPSAALIGGFGALLLLRRRRND